jgi:8-oxo-dGTP pyrophosphatase MutT (NUDIX family)
MIAVLKSARARLALFNDAGQALIMVRKKDGLKILLAPGGGLDPGEDFYDAINREVSEELLFSTTPSIYFHKTTYSSRQGHQVGAFEKNYFDCDNPQLHTWSGWFVARMPKGATLSVGEPEKFSDLVWLRPEEIIPYAALSDCDVGDGLESLAVHYDYLNTIR